jgi:hypothetical protein
MLPLGPSSTVPELVYPSVLAENTHPSRCQPISTSSLSGLWCRSQETLVFLDSGSLFVV